MVGRTFTATSEGMYISAPKKIEDESMRLLVGHLDHLSEPGRRYVHAVRLGVVATFARDCWVEECERATEGENNRTSQGKLARRREERQRGTCRHNGGGSTR